MSYGHGKNGPLRDVVEILSGWSSRKPGNYLRRVLLNCGHIIAQTGTKSQRVLSNGQYTYGDIRNLNTHKRAFCHICKMEADNE